MSQLYQNIEQCVDVWPLFGLCDSIHFALAISRVCHEIIIYCLYWLPSPFQMSCVALRKCFSDLCLYNSLWYQVPLVYWRLDINTIGIKSLIRNIESNPSRSIFPFFAIYFPLPIAITLVTDCSKQCFLITIDFSGDCIHLTTDLNSYVPTRFLKKKNLHVNHSSVELWRNN